MKFKNFITEAFTTKTLIHNEINALYIAAKYENDKSGNHNIYDRLKYLISNEAFKEISFCVFDKNKLIGVGGIEKNIYSKFNNEYWIKHISVDKKYQKIGIAKKIIDNIMKYASENKIKLENSMYSEEGWKYLKPLMLKFAKKYHVNFKDSEEHY